MGANLDMDRNAKAMGAERRGKVAARGGYFGALELAADLDFRKAAGVLSIRRGACNAFQPEGLVALSPGQGGEALAALGRRA